MYEIQIKRQIFRLDSNWADFVSCQLSYLNMSFYYEKNYYIYVIDWTTVMDLFNKVSKPRIFTYIFKY